jgi:hypothetical protein
MKTTAVMRFTGGPGREKDAALAWGFELKYYFTRGVDDDPPAVTYKDGVYTCAGTMTTSHPADRHPVTEFNKDMDDIAPLNFILNPERMAGLRELYPRRSMKFDGS